MGEAREVMRALKAERDEIRSHLDGMQVCVWLIVSCLVAWRRYRRGHVDAAPPLGTLGEQARCPGPVDKTRSVWSE